MTMFGSWPLGSELWSAEGEQRTLGVVVEVVVKLLDGQSLEVEATLWFRCAKTSTIMTKSVCITTLTKCNMA